MDRVIAIAVRDRYGQLIPGATVEIFVGGELFLAMELEGGRGSARPKPPDAIIELQASYQGNRSERVKLAADQTRCALNIDIIGGISMARFNIILQYAVAFFIIAAGLVGFFYVGQKFEMLALVVGVLLLLVALGLAFAFPKPTSLQAQLIRSTFALGAGGIASAIPGLLNVNLPLPGQVLITASGAIAVYVITFFFVPAGQDPPPNPQASTQA